MAASKSTPPSLPGKLAPVSAGVKPIKKIRAGMGDIESETVEVWSDEDHQRATGLLTLLAPDGKAARGAPPELSPEALRELHRGMLRMRLLDERMLGL